MVRGKETGDRRKVFGFKGRKETGKRKQVVRAYYVGFEVSCHPLSCHLSPVPFLKRFRPAGDDAKVPL